MKKKIERMAGSAWVLLAAISLGQEPVLTSIQGNGQVSWTNAVNSNALYRVEWAAQADGPWQRTLDNVASLDGHSATGFTVAVPMFYRVAMATNPPPAGMVWIDGGDVELGQIGIAEPVHTNFISGFWMDAKEVPAWQWERVYAWATNHGYQFNNAGLIHPARYTHPVYGLDWYDCVKWCNARSEMEDLDPVYLQQILPDVVYRTNEIAIPNGLVAWNRNGYRLPTEAEWEKAARGGRQRRFFPWGADTIQHDWATYFATGTEPYDTSPTIGTSPYSDGLTPATSPGGSLPANAYGLYDMAGNVWEWCWDWYDAYSGEYAVDPPGPSTGEKRIVRGGDSDMDAPFARCAHRANAWPDVGTPPPYMGFRCVRRP